MRRSLRAAGLVAIPSIFDGELLEKAGDECRNLRSIWCNGYRLGSDAFSCCLLAYSNETDDRSWHEEESEVSELFLARVTKTGVRREVMGSQEYGGTSASLREDLRLPLPFLMKPEHEPSQQAPADSQT